MFNKIKIHLITLVIFGMFPVVSLAANITFTADTILTFNPDASPVISVASSSACDTLVISGTDINVNVPDGNTFTLKNSYTNALVGVTPSGGSVSLILDVSSSAEEYVSGYVIKWQATSTSSTATASFSIGRGNANTWYQVNVNGSYYGTYESNSSGVVTFTYSGGFSDTKTFTIAADTTAPSSFSLVSPANQSNVVNQTPTFTWNACSDSDFSHYAFYLDSSALSSNLLTNSYTAISNISCGSHTWFVRAYDDAGNYTNSSVFNFTMVCGGGLPANVLTPPSPPAGGFKILINSDNPTTNSQKVTLFLFGGPNAKMMAISNYSDFRDSIQIPYHQEYQWTLLPNYGTKTVYAKFYTQYGQSSKVVSDTINYQANGMETINISLQDGDLIRNPQANGLAKYDVYVIKIVGHKKFKRLIINPKVFESYGDQFDHNKNGNPWDDIKQVSQSTMDSFKTSNLVRCFDPSVGINDPKVYQLNPNGDQGTKTWLNLTPQQFEQNHDWDSIFIINRVERELYQG